jgi:tetratricopeptide (TPR) repeat protein
MTGPIREELARAEQLLEQGEYAEALDLVQMLAAQELSAEEWRPCRLLECRLAVKLGDWEEGLALVEEALQAAREGEEPLLVVDLLTVRVEACWRRGELKQGLEVVAEAETLLAALPAELPGLPEDEIERREAELLQHVGITRWYRGELDLALECHQRSHALRERLGDRKGVADCFNNLGLVHWSRGDYNMALECYRQSLEIAEELGYRRNVATLLTNMGNIYAGTGDLDQALIHQNRSLAINQELGHRQQVYNSLINLGVVHQFKGELVQAEERYRQALGIAEELGVKRGIALAFNNLGNVHQIRGDLQRALERFETSLALYRELEDPEQIALLLTNIGEIQRLGGHLERALESYGKSLAIYEEFGHELMIAMVLFELVWIALEQGDHDLAEEYLGRLQAIDAGTDNRTISQRSRVARALALKAKERARDRLKAADILEQVVEEEVANHALTVSAMIQLCDLRLYELKLTGEEELFGEIKDLTRRLGEIAAEQSSHSLLAETYLLQSKLALIELDMGRARTLLSEAQAIAEEKGLSTLARAVARARDRLEGQVQMWEMIIQRKPSRREMIDLTQLDELLGQMVQGKVAVPATGALEEGILNGRYRLDAELGRGGMGAVYRAHDLLLKRDVAVKVVSEAGLSTEGRARLLREAQSAAQLNHPNVVSVYDVGEVALPGSGGQAPFIVMELVEGESLHARRPDDPGEIVGIMGQVCAALAHAHEYGIVHRDLKPENVMVTADGRAKLLDFGLARTVASRLTAEGTLVGTVFYVAPEQALGQEVDGRADLYALGVLLYELLTGRLPFDADDPLAVIGQHLHAPVVSPTEYNPEIPDGLRDLILQLLSKNPEDRPASAGEVGTVLGCLAASV